MDGISNEELLTDFHPIPVPKVVIERKRRESVAPCLDCGIDTHFSKGIKEYYMVEDSVWKEAGARSGWLCLGCLETRLGRRLTSVDFLDCPLNRDAHLQSDRLKDRLSS